MRRGEIRWYTFALPDKRRPVLLLSRDAMLASLNEVIVVPATRTIRGLDTEVVLTEDDGMPTACALNLDHASLASSFFRRGLVITEPERLRDFAPTQGLEPWTRRLTAACSTN